MTLRLLKGQRNDLLEDVGSFKPVDFEWEDGRIQWIDGYIYPAEVLKHRPTKFYFAIESSPDGFRYERNATTPLAPQLPQVPVAVVSSAPETSTNCRAIAFRRSAGCNF